MNWAVVGQWRSWSTDSPGQDRSSRVWLAVLAAPREGQAVSVNGRRDQLSRLFQILFALRSGHPNATELGELCEVSLRTIYRDLSTLELAGVPIQYRADYQGYEIAPTFALPVPNLSRAEMVALMAAARVIEEEGGFLGKKSRVAVGKVLSALPASDRRAIEEIGKLMIWGKEPMRGAGPSALGEVSEALIDGLSSGRQVRTWFEEGDGRVRAPILHEERLGLYRLVRMSREWHLLGHREKSGSSTVALGLRTIRRAELTDQPFVMPGEGEVQRLLGMAGMGMPVPPTGILVRLRVVTPRVEELGETVWHPVPHFAMDSPGWQEITRVVEELDSFLMGLKAMGEEVEVLAPSRVVSRMNELRERSSREPAPYRVFEGYREAE